MTDLSGVIDSFLPNPTFSMGPASADIQSFLPVPTFETAGPRDRGLIENNRNYDIQGEFDPRSFASVSVTATQVRYRMRGYRVAISDYEYWIATDPNASPPSGNTLVAIAIDARLQST